MSTTWTRTAGQLLTAVLQNIGVLDIAGTLGTTTAESRLMHGIVFLNAYLKNVMAPNNAVQPGIKIWQHALATITLNGTKSAYTFLYHATASLGGDVVIDPPVDIISVLRRNSSNEDAPLDRMSEVEYDHLVEKSRSGTPLKFFYKRAMGTATMWLDCKPSNITTYPYLIVNYMKILDDISGYTDAIEMPSEWMRALIWNLSVELASSYGKPVTQEMIAMANQSLEFTGAMYPENTEVYFEPGRDD